MKVFGLCLLLFACLDAMPAEVDINNVSVIYRRVPFMNLPSTQPPIYVAETAPIRVFCSSASNYQFPQDLSKIHSLL